MRNLNVLLAATALVLSLFSCKKEDGIDPIDKTEEKEHYMPLKEGNSWEYSSAAFGNYTVSVTGKETIDNFEYYTVYSTANSTTGYMNYDGNKLYTISSTNAGGQVKLLLLDEDASVGQSWLAGTIETVIPGSAVSTVTYTCEYVDHHDSYTVNSTTYEDVIEVNMTTTVTVEFDQSILDMLDQETIDMMTAMYEEQAEANAITQRTFYAKNVGFVFQYSNDMPNLGAELLSYNVQ